MAVVFIAAPTGITAKIVLEEFRDGDISVVEMLIPLGFVVYGIVFMVVQIRRIAGVVRIRRAWRRAARGQVAQVLVGLVLPHVREVSTYRVRTVVADVGGQTRFIRLALTPDAVPPAKGPVRMDLFDPHRVRGPARLHPKHGRGGWAFATRVGNLAVPEETPWQLEGGWSADWSDGWTKKDERADPKSGWPGDSDGDDGDGDGDGGD